MKILVRCLSAIGLLAIASTSRAQVLDQSNNVTTAVFDGAVVTGQSLAQTFTVGLTGTLAEVDFQIYKSTGTTGDLTFSIRTTQGGVPNADNSQSLFQTVVPLTSIPTFDSFPATVPFTQIDVSSAGISVVPGEVLTLALSRTGPGSPPWVLWRSSGDVYSGGSEFVRANETAAWTPLGLNVDAGFQTFVTPSAVPEPGSLAFLAASGLTGATIMLRRRRRNTVAG